ncbi:PREDICTED: uncharacterized protein LOC105560380 isoform X1 [Vollenhovia emeryi]|uniref:uncharacterized protein LOC105560380 isoform X1 n=1 Tax=Vollenhovia emeryi TaxID=411798 RepID=UPI0005F4FF55|nr:PREDICTED: uncharacterized protein LOC105560380 isoform X1 [Vollenhovia emeryi]
MTSNGKRKYTWNLSVFLAESMNRQSPCAGSSSNNDQRPASEQGDEGVTGKAHLPSGNRCLRPSDPQRSTLLCDQCFDRSHSRSASPLDDDERLWEGDCVRGLCKNG